MTRPDSPSDTHRDHRPPWVRNGQKPPWWPQDEPWPPERPPWEVARRRTLLRIVLIATGVLVALMLLGWILGNLVFGGSWHTSSEPNDGGPPYPVRILFILLLVAGVGFIVRRIRHYATPLVDVMAATDRVAAGDYAVHVEATGPRTIRRTIDAFNAMAMRLEENETQRRQFFADIAHEVRTPLAVIQGNVEGMLDGVYPRDDAHLAPLLDEVNVLSRLMTDLGTLATAEAGTMRLDRSPVDVRALLDDVREAFAPQASGAGVRLETRGDESILADLDPIRMRQVLDNIVSNALRYTPTGGMVVLEATASQTEIRIEIRDTGRGLTPEDAARMFDRFVKAADSGGSGLGLAIAKGIVVAHGGQIGATSIPDVGTTVWITMPHR